MRKGSDYYDSIKDVTIQSADGRTSRENEEHRIVFNCMWETTVGMPDEYYKQELLRCLYELNGFINSKIYELRKTKER